MQNSSHTLRSGQTLQIQAATPDHSGELLKFIDETSGESDNLSFGPGEFGVSEAQEKAILADFLKADNKLYLIALMNHEIVGSLTFNAGGRKRVSHFGGFGMCVRKKYWRAGIGAILVDSMIRWAEEQGTILKINLSVRTDNLPAIQLYLKKGFLIEGRTLDALRIDGISYDTYAMGRSIISTANPPISPA